MARQHDPSQMMGLWMTTALVVGSIIGSGIFMLPVSLAPLGVNAIAGWVISILGAIAVAFALARLSRAGGGGIQSYIEEAFGPTAGFIVTWAFWCSNWSAQAGIAIAFGSALSRISPLLQGPEAIVATALAAIVLLTVVNALGVRAAGAVNVVTVVIKVVPLFGVVVLLVMTWMSNRTFEPLAATPLTTANIATATTLTLFALTGFENATTPVGKVRDPARTIPRAILGGTIAVGVLYLLSSSGVTLLVSSDVVASSPAPYADVFAARGGETMVLFAAIAIAVSAFGTLNSGVLSTGELGYAMALRRQLPAVLARTRGADTPYIAQILGSVMAAALVLANSSRATAGLFAFVILLATSAILLVYVVGALATWRANSSLAARSVLIVAFLFIAFAFYGAGMEANFWCLMLIVAGLGVRAVAKRFNSSGTSLALEAAPAVPPGSSA